MRSVCRGTFKGAYLFDIELLVKQLSKRLRIMMMRTIIMRQLMMCDGLDVTAASSSGANRSMDDYH